MSKIAGDINREMMKFPLEKNRSDAFYRSGKVFPWIKCKPFVENKRGVLIHRPRSAETFNLHKNQHIGISFWCGMAVTDSSGKKLTLLDVPPEGGILCERCEAAAVKAGLPTADQLAGRHVHKGRTVPVITCCKTQEENK